MLPPPRQILVITSGIFFLVLGIRTMLQTPTIILPSWFLVLLFLPILIIVSLTLGYLTRLATKCRWQTVTLSSIYTTIICFAFYLSEYKRSYVIHLPDNFKGEVKLFIARGEKNDFHISSYGVGYITEKTYRDGFRPVIRMGGEEISTGVTQFSINSFASMDSKRDFQFDYLSFRVSASADDPDELGIEELLRLSAIDTIITKLIPASPTCSDLDSA